MSVEIPSGDKEKSPSGKPSYSIRAVERVCDILDLLQESGDGTLLSDIARVTDLPTSSAFRYLAVLESRRYVERDAENAQYRLGLAFLPMQSRDLGLLKERARPHLERLRERFGETVNLGVLDGHRVVYAEILESPKSMRLAARPGDRDHIHCTALGKAIASQLPKDRVLEILFAEGMPALTTNSITDIDEYLAELQSVRETGFAIDERENEAEGRCLSVPVPGYHLPAAISLSAPQAYFPKEQIEGVAAAFQEASLSLASELNGGTSEQGC